MLDQENHVPAKEERKTVLSQKKNMQYKGEEGKNERRANKYEEQKEGIYGQLRRGKGMGQKGRPNP